MATPEVTIHPPQQTEETNTNNNNNEEEKHNRQENKPTPIANLAALAADAGRKMHADAQVYEGSGKVNAAGNKENPKPSSPSPIHGAASPVVGGVRVMPAADEEMKKILAARLRKTE